MVKGKSKEYIVSNYILQNTNLLFEESISDIEIKEKGRVVELTLYYNPASKYDVWRLRKEFLKEPQHIVTTIKRGMLCAKFYAPTKYADLIICKLHTVEPSIGINRIIECVKTKNRAARDE